MDAIKKPRKRLLSIDVLRGITIAGMVLVNNAGACGFCYAPLHHAKWDGFNPADLVFPMFMFVMGISIYLSLSRHEFNFKVSIGRVVRRTFLIIFAGIALKWVLNSMESGNWLDFENMRILGVLQRLGICYGIVAVMALLVQHKRFPVIIGALLVFYLTLQLIGNGFEKCADNIMAIVDNAVLGANHMYLHGKQFVDPEGIMSTIPAVTQVMIGFLCGRELMRREDNKDKMLHFLLVGAALLFAGFLLSYVTPLNKRLWSPSFVLVTCGISYMVLALLIEIIDEKKYTKWAQPFKIIGVNPLIIYIVSEIAGDGLRDLGVPDWTFANVLQPIFGDYMGSCIYAVIFVGLMWLMGYVLYRKNILIKL